MQVASDPDNSLARVEHEMRMAQRMQVRLYPSINIRPSTFVHLYPTSQIRPSFFVVLVNNSLVLINSCIVQRHVILTGLAPGPDNYLARVENEMRMAQRIQVRLHPFIYIRTSILVHLYSSIFIRPSIFVVLISNSLVLIDNCVVPKHVIFDRICAGPRQLPGQSRARDAHGSTNAGPCIFVLQFNNWHTWLSMPDAGPSIFIAQLNNGVYGVGV